MSTIRETLFGTIVLLLSSSCSIICGVACDWVEAGECLSEGKLFGPCTSTASCDVGLTCRITSQGDICIPPIELIDVREAEEEAEACADWRGEFGLKCNPNWGTCHIPCATDSHCINGTVCAEDWEICVYPRNAEDVQPPMGETLGPCMGDDMLCLHETDTCVVSTVVDGNICSRIGEFWLAQCSKEDPFCPNGQVCSTDKKVCVWPK